jgi:hypothetical protein
MTRTREKYRLGAALSGSMIPSSFLIRPSFISQRFRWMETGGPIRRQVAEQKTG